MVVTGFSALVIALVQAPEPSTPFVAQVQAQVAQQKAGKADPKSSMDRCMQTWDRATQMSKQEWRETCKRTIKENPGLYDKPF